MKLWLSTANGSRGEADVVRSVRPLGVKNADILFNLAIKQSKKIEILPQIILSSR